MWRPCRSFGCSAPVGTVYSINPAMIMALVPLIGAAATHYSHFDMIHYGSYVSALSPLWMALFTTGDFVTMLAFEPQTLTTPPPPYQPLAPHSSLRWPCERLSHAPMHDCERPDTLVRDIDSSILLVKHCCHLVRYCDRRCCVGMICCKTNSTTPAR